LADYPTAALRAAEKPEDHFAGPEEKKAEEA